MPGTLVNIVGGSGNASGVTGGFSCTARVEAGQFTVPPYILLSLPAGQGNLDLINNSAFGSFSATGLDLAQGYGGITIALGSVTYN